MNAIQTLQYLKTLLPGDTPNKTEGEFSFATLDGFIDDGEPELALDTLVYIADAHHDNKTPLNADFWNSTKRLAVHLADLNQSSTYAGTIADSLNAIDHHFPSPVHYRPTRRTARRRDSAGLPP